MNGSLIDRYISKKEKDLYEYIRFIASLMTVDENKVWQTKKEFNTYVKGILKIYTKNYYFANNEHIENAVKYINSNSDYVIKSIIQYFKSENKLTTINSARKENFLLYVVISSACFIDFASNIETGDPDLAKQKFVILLEYLNKNPLIKVNKKENLIEDLFKCVKTNIQEDNKILNSIQDDNYKMEYSIINSKPKCLKATFKYNIPDLEEFDKDVTAKVIKSYQGKINEAMFMTLEFDLLRELISDRTMPLFLVNINNAMKRTSILNFFTNRYVKEYIGILVPYNDRHNYKKVIDTFRENNIMIIYDYEGLELVKPNDFEDDIKLLVNQPFVINNIDNRYNFIKKKIEVIVKNEED